MKSTDFLFESKDGQKIFVYKWIPDTSFSVPKNGRENNTGYSSFQGKSITAKNQDYTSAGNKTQERATPKAVIHIIHGMGEHAGRYEEFAKFLTDNGFAVYAADQRGHGKTAKDLDMLGHFADKNGWFIVVDDLKILNDIIAEENPGAGIFLFGHSAGAMLALDFIIKYPDNIKGAVLSGTSGNPGLLGYVGILLAKPVIKRRGPAAKSPIHKKLLFEKYNSYFKPNRTSADWVTRDEKAVDEMLADPYVFQLFSAAFYDNLARAALRANSLGHLKKLPKEMPFFIISGSECAVGGFGKGVKSVYRAFLEAGLKDVEFKLYQGARHEIINEINREEVFADILSWLIKKQQ